MPRQRVPRPPIHQEAITMFKKLLIVAALAATATGAHAQLAYATTGTYLPAIAGNDVPSFASGLLDAQISTALPGTLSVTFLGKEAGHSNLFGVYGTTTLEMLNNLAVGTTQTVDVAAGALPFRFKDNNDNTTVSNGGNAPTSAQGSYVIFGTRAQNGDWTALTSYGGGSFDLIIGFNDGAKVDADYDDHVLGLSLAPVPEPGTYAMMLAGLAAMGFIARRRSRG
jgi:hypothetical protein